MDDAKLKRKQLIDAAMDAADKELATEQEALQRCLEEITAEREAIACAWNALISSFGPYAEEEKRIEDQPLPSVLKDLLEDNPGMTELIRSILRASAEQEFSPPQMRDLLVEAGFDLEGRSNPLSEVHMILKRLASKAKEHISVRETDGATLYKYSRGKTSVPRRIITRRMKKSSTLNESAEN